MIEKKCGHLKGNVDAVNITDNQTAIVRMSSIAAAKLALEQESMEDKPRIDVEFEDAKERVSDFREVEKGFTEEDARREATRCLRCDLEKEENGI